MSADDLLDCGHKEHRTMLVMRCISCEDSNRDKLAARDAEIKACDARAARFDEQRENAESALHEIETFFDPHMSPGGDLVWLIKNYVGNLQSSIAARDLEIKKLRGALERIRDAHYECLLSSTDACADEPACIPCVAREALALPDEVQTK